MSTGNGGSMSKLVDALVDIMPAYFSPPTPSLELQQHQTLMLEAQQKRKELWGKYQPAYVTPPLVASSTRREEIERLGREMEAANAKFSVSQVVVMEKALAALKREFEEAKREFEERQKHLVESLAEQEKSALQLEIVAPSDEFQVLEDRHAKLLNEIEDSKANMDSLASLDDEIEIFREMITQTRVRVEQRQEEKKSIEEAMEQVSLPVEAQPNALDSQRSAVSEQLNRVPLTDDALKEASNCLMSLQKAAEDLSAKIALQKLKYVEFTLQFEIAKEQSKHELAWVNPEKPKEMLEPLVKACELLLQPPPFDDETDGRWAKFPEALQKLKTQASFNVANSARGSKRGLLLPYFQKEYQAVEAEWKRLANLPGTSFDLKNEPSWLKMAKPSEKEIPRGGPLREIGSKMQDRLDKARAQLALARDNAIETAAKWHRQKEEMLSKVGQGDPPNVASDFADELADLREKVKKPLAGTLNEEVLQSAAKNVQRFVDLLARARNDAVDGAVVKEIRQRLQERWQKIYDGARKPVQKELQDALEAATSIAETKGTRRNMKRARELFMALENRLNDVEKERPKKLSAVEALTSRKIDTVSVSSETAEEIYDLLGPDVLTILGTGNRGETDMQTVCAAFHGAAKEEVKALSDFFLEGLAGHGNALLAVVRAGDGKALRALAMSFAGDGEKEKGERIRLGLMVGSGGMSENPEVLGDLLGFGLSDAIDKDAKRQQNITSLKEISETFGTKNGAGRLKTLLDDCGFATRPTTDRPGAFAEIMLNDGCSAKDLSQFVGGLGTEDKKNLKGVMQNGGLGDHPAPLAPLVKGSKLDALKNIGNAFAQPSDRAKLKCMMDSGGLSGDAPRPGQEHEHPDTLAKVYKDGLGGSAANLVTFTKTFASVPGQCKKMLDAWNEYPDGFKEHRKPGKQIAKVLNRMGGGNIDQKIAQLQSQFTANIVQIADPTKRQSAFRFAPDVAIEPTPTSLTAPQNMPQDYVLDTSVQGQSLLRRHVAKYFSRATVDNFNTMWPVETNANKVTENLRLAIAQCTQGNGTMPGNDLPGSQNRNKRVCDIGGGKMVEFAAQSYDNGQTVTINHFHAGAGWPNPPHPEEVVTFTRQQMESMLDAVGK